MALLSAFNPHDLSEATVRTVATGRESDLALVLKTVRDNLGAATMQHLIVSGPRGFGKSFLMRHVEIEILRIARDENLPLVPVLMPEEMPHVKEPETLVRELTRALTGGAGADAELTWHEDEGSAWDAAVDGLGAAIRDKVGERGLVVALVENFDLLLRRAFPRDLHRSRLRALLTAPGGRLMLIAASASGAFDRDYDDRLFQAFREITLEPWTIDECLAFFDRQRRDAGKAPLDDLARARARAVSTFIGGTPRLATLLGDALLTDDVLGAAELLQKLVDELTPYYKERIEALPGRSQKLLDALLRGGEPATQSEIAKRVKANSQAAIAGPFNDLVRERVVVGDKAPGSAEVLYRVADRVFAHYYRRRVVDHGSAPCALEALVDLLASFFTPEEKQAKATEFARSGRLAEARLMARLHDADRGTSKIARRWMLNDLANRYIPKRLISLASEAVADRLRTVGDLATKGEVDRAYLVVDEALASTEQPHDRVLLLLARSRLDAYEGIEQGLAAAEQAVAVASDVGDDDYVFVAEFVRLWSLGSTGHDVEAIEIGRHLAARAETANRTLDQAIALRYVAFSFGNLGRHEEAVTTARQAADLAKKAGDTLAQAIALRHAAFSLGSLGRHDEAVATARQAADLAETADDAREQAVALRLAAFSLGELGRHDEAVATARQAADLAETAGNVRGQAIALRNAAFNLGSLGRHEEAVATARHAADSAEKVGDMEMQVDANCDAALSLMKLGRYDEAEATTRTAVDLAQNAGLLDAQADALEMLAVCLACSGEQTDAIETLARSAEVFEADRGSLPSAARTVGSIAALDVSEADRDPQRLHELLRAAADNLGVAGLRQTCLNEWLVGFVENTVRRSDNLSRLESTAAAIALHFPGRFETLTTRLREAARYHASGRDRKALARLDPDFARALETMFRPPEPPPKAKGKRSDRRKPTRRRKA